MSRYKYRLDSLNKRTRGRQHEDGGIVKAAIATWMTKATNGLKLILERPSASSET